MKYSCKVKLTIAFSLNFRMNYSEYYLIRTQIVKKYWLNVLLCFTTVVSCLRWRNEIAWISKLILVKPIQLCNHKCCENLRADDHIFTFLNNDVDCHREINLSALPRSDKTSFPCRNKTLSTRTDYKRVSGYLYRRS